MFIDHVQCRFNWLNNRPHTCTHKSYARLINKSIDIYIKNQIAVQSLIRMRVTFRNPFQIILIVLNNKYFHLLVLKKTN